MLIHPHLQVRHPGFMTQIAGALAIATREWLILRRHIVDVTTGPLFATALYLTVFSLALGPAAGLAGGVAVLTHLAPGLVVVIGMMVAPQSISATVLMSKHEHSISTLLMAPLSPLTLVCGYTLAAMVAGGLVSLGVFGVTSFFAPPTPDWPVLITFVVLGLAALGLLGLLIGLWAQKWDQYALVYEVTVMPLMLISGAYVPVTNMHSIAQTIAYASPLTYLVSGVRHGYRGTAELPLALTLGVTLAMLAVLLLATVTLVTRGWRLKD